MLAAICITALAFAFYAVYRSYQYRKIKEWDDAIKWSTLAMQLSMGSIAAGVLNLLMR